MRLSELPIFDTWRERNSQQVREVGENSKKRPARVWRMSDRCGWGSSIGWCTLPTEESQGKGRVYGHLTPLPIVGDSVASSMQSGRTGLYRFTTIEYCTDPSDMFFADVEWQGYEGDSK